jgi:hypothetical protein
MVQNSNLCAVIITSKGCSFVTSQERIFQLQLLKGEMLDMVGEMMDRVGNVWLVLDQQQPFFTTVVRKELLPCLLNVSELLSPSAIEISVLGS